MKTGSSAENWRKSSRSNSVGNQCIEVAALELWSRRSGSVEDPRQ
jgi:Domain of unknown function (DUF397)